MGTESAGWQRCSTCKGDIDFEQAYYVCSVSTCNRGATEFRFCSVECWDAHVPVMRHRDAGAVESRSPSRAEWEQQHPVPEPDEPEESDGGAVALSEDGIPHDVLVVVSKLKAYIRARSGMSTSDAAIPVLSDHLRKLCDGAIRVAARDGRKTVMDRDFRAIL